MKFRLGERVHGNILFGNGLQTEGVVVREDAGISRDAIVVELDNGDTAIMLESTVTKGANMQYEVYTSRFDVPEELYMSFRAETHEEAIRKFYELKGKESLAWDSLRMVQVVTERKERPVASLSRMPGCDDKDKVIIHD